jgi:hypothetical protein
MDTVGLDIQAGAKALVPNEFRPIADKESWGQPLLTGRQFLGILAAAIASSVSGLLLYYSVSTYHHLLLVYLIHSLVLRCIHSELRRNVLPSCQVTKHPRAADRWILSQNHATHFFILRVAIHC